ncbi:uncharacterized protein MONBRDRAFT_17087 [Monosiga brevicollis MX1]|uniref:uroporphyrinogen-III C-methyltransferase n=1 Tax=Monosiga brevicollis TaxID=81824 RepID=A9UPE8_MONBE|nr:uncharacterized protein MONBRDRAFT_17087 [Monosiga brevicollis MX1]EDQ92408.1 predicted protein [Monosiga brevicollis MX1]|eukprot:XP_001742170.1 hypothetical protein [Monosiga brevicollis MX1]
MAAAAAAAGVAWVTWGDPSSVSAIEPSHVAGAHTGKVYLVGAGPGAADLLTLRAARLLATADVVVSDALIGPEILAGVREDCLVITMGKRGGDARATKQTDINTALVEQAQQGRTVVRLKGGDPLLFGRVAEEMRALDAAGVAYEIVPGITSPFAAAAEVGIPLTHKTLSTTLVLTTGHDPSLLDFTALARMDTVAIVMATRTLEAIVDGLVEGGKAPSTPVCIVRNTTLPNGAIYTGTLDRVVADTERLKLSPAVLIVGEVAALAQGGGCTPDRLSAEL